MVTSGSTLYADFGGSGLWKWNGSSWSQLTSANPENMVASGSVLYVDFGAQASGNGMAAAGLNSHRPTLKTWWPQVRRSMWTLDQLMASINGMVAVGLNSLGPIPR